MENLANLHRRAARQHGLLTRTDLDELAITRGVRRRLVAEGTLVAVGPRVFRVGGAPASRNQRVLAATLDTGGFASHRTAAALYGLDGIDEPDLPEVTVDRRTKRFRSEIAQVHSTLWLPGSHCVVVEGVPTLNVARTLLSLASMVPTSLAHDVVAGAVEQAIATRRATDPWIWWLLEQTRRNGRDGVAVLEAVLASRDAGFVTESWLEREFLSILREAGVPLPICQKRVAEQGAFVARVDFVYEPRSLIIEVSGHAWHHTRAQRARDTARRRRLVLAGFRVLEFTYEDIVGDRAAVAGTVIAALGEEGLKSAG